MSTDTVATSPAVARLGRWDQIGLAVSSVCVAHCLLLPVVLALLPLWPLGDALHAWLHPLFALLLIPTTLFAGILGYRQHRQQSIPVLLGIGLFIIVAAGFLGTAVLGHLLEPALTIAGSTLLIAGHWRNWRADRCCEVATTCPRHEDHDHS